MAMKTYEEILEEMCEDNFEMSFKKCCDGLLFSTIKIIVIKAAKIYAKQVVEYDREVYEDLSSINQPIKLP
jgi:hypothetical protein